MKFSILISSLALVPVCFAGDYSFTVERIIAQQTRSAYYDTLIGAINIIVRSPNLNPMVWNTTKVMGNHGGSWPDSFIPSNFGIDFSAADNASVEISVIVVNKKNASETDSGPLLDGLFGAVGNGIDAFTRGGLFKALGSSINTSLNKIGDIRNLCDGTVIADALSLTPSDLQSITKLDDIHPVQDLGSESPKGCGPNSSYMFWYRIHRQDRPHTVTLAIDLPTFGHATTSGSVSSTRASTPNTASISIIPGSLLVALSVLVLAFSIVTSN